MTNPPASIVIEGQVQEVQEGRARGPRLPLVKTNVKIMAPGGEHEAILPRYQKKTLVADLPDECPPLKIFPGESTVDACNKKRSHPPKGDGNPKRALRYRRI